MRRVVQLSMILQLSVCPALAWSAHGHRTITCLALDALPAEAPAWLRDPQVRERIAYQSNLADRWRGWRSPTLVHENAPDHFIDIEDLEGFGLTLETVPRLRYEYLRALAVAKHVHPEAAPEYDAASDPERTKEWPGFLLHSIAEHYAKLAAAFNEVRVLERLVEGQPAGTQPATASAGVPTGDGRRLAALRRQLDAARQTAIYHMGMLSHFVGDAAQPLHTTRHYNGWRGDNPQGYTPSNRFHAYIDGKALDDHRIDCPSLRSRIPPLPDVDPHDPWPGILAHVQRSHEQVEPLYRLERDGQLHGPPGRDLIQGRILDAATTLAALYWAAYTSAAPTPQQVADYVFYDDLRPEPLPADEPSPRPTP